MGLGDVLEEEFCRVATELAVLAGGRRVLACSFLWRRPAEEPGGLGSTIGHFNLPQVGFNCTVCGADVQEAPSGQLLCVGEWRLREISSRSWMTQLQRVRPPTMPGDGRRLANVDRVHSQVMFADKGFVDVRALQSSHHTVTTFAGQRSRLGPAKRRRKPSRRAPGGAEIECARRIRIG
jgi:hypothetical protein